MRMIIIGAVAETNTDKVGDTRKIGSSMRQVRTCHQTFVTAGDGARLSVKEHEDICDPCEDTCDTGEKK